MTTRDLARRLERTEALACAAFVDSRAASDPGTGACWIDVAGAHAMFDGTESPMTQSFGLGVFEPFGAPEFERVEAFYQSRNAHTDHEVCDLADRAATGQLAPRGYTEIESSVVMVRPVSAPSPTPDPSIVVRRVGPNEGDRWARVAGRGWGSESAALAAFVESLGAITARARGAHCFLASLDGVDIAAGALKLSGTVALLSGASTVPEARRRGAQRALLYARLQFAAMAGAELAMVVTQAGSASNRNARSQGFIAVYGRTKWRREARHHPTLQEES